jgi:hypothetical protein
MVNSGDAAGLVAALAAAQTELVRTEQEAAAAIGKARGEVATARRRVDEFRLGLIEDAFESGRQRHPSIMVDNRTYLRHTETTAPSTAPPCATPQNGATLPSR